MNDCGGVLVPDGDGTRRVCFVEERGVHPSGRPFSARELAPSLDHYVPTSMGGADDPSNIHTVHLYCQNVQGGMVGRGQSKVREGINAIVHDDAHRARPLYRESRSRTGRRRFELYGSPGTHEGSVKGGYVGMCSRWNIRRGKPCTCGHHMLSQP